MKEPSISRHRNNDLQCKNHQDRQAAMWMAPAVTILVTHREFNASVDCPGLWSKDRRVLSDEYWTLLWMDSCAKGILFQTTPKNQYNADIKFVSIWTRPSHFKGVHSMELHCHSSRHAHFATLLWRWNNLSTMVVVDCSGLRCLWPDNALDFGTCQDFCGVIFLSSPQKFISDFLPQVILFQVLTSLWIRHQRLSCYGQPECQLLSSPNSKQNTAVKTPPLCCRCNFAQAV